MMLGVGGGGSRSFLEGGRLAVFGEFDVGGGDVSRFFAIGPGRPARCNLCTSPPNSELTGDGTRPPAAAKALCIAAADGVAGILYGTLDVRCGL